MSVLFKGGCFCGRIRYEATGAPTNATICHCADCRRASGSPMVGWMTFKQTDVSFLHEIPRSFASSPGVRRSFCPGCGTSLTYRRGERDEVDLTISSLDDPSAVSPVDHVWTISQLRWVKVGDELPQHRREREPAEGAALVADELSAVDPIATGLIAQEHEPPT